jgi:ATP-dependent RNA helicase RhlE
MSFDTLGLSAEILRAVSDQGYSEPTPVQREAIPVILDGKDILAGAQTGTGKTAGFTLPLLQRLSDSTPAKGRRPVRALVLTPTRELAAQVAESIETYGKYLPLSSTVIFGGVKINPQIKRLRAGVDILVATPGRLLDHVSQRTLDLSAVEILVLDEADRMLDMGFIRDIRKIIALMPRQRQNLLFSATYSNDMRKLADSLLKSPVSIEVARRNTPTELVSQVVHPVDRERKRELLSFMVGSQNWRQVLVFTRTKHGANRLSQQLEKDGISSAAIHGNKSQGARTRALADFKQGEVRVLVATDIAARGLDIDQLPHVVNYELPNVPEDYVHRIGRTGRAGNEGEAVSLVCVDEHKLLGDIERSNVTCLKLSFRDTNRILLSVRNRFKRDAVRLEIPDPVTVPGIRVVKDRVPVVVLRARRVRVLQPVVASPPVAVIQRVRQGLMATARLAGNRVSALRRQVTCNDCCC